jgi:hypothetical protein
VAAVGAVNAFRNSGNGNIVNVMGTVATRDEGNGIGNSASHRKVVEGGNGERGDGKRKGSKDGGNALRRKEGSRDLGKELGKDATPKGLGIGVEVVRKENDKDGTTTGSREVGMGENKLEVRGLHSRGRSGDWTGRRGSGDAVRDIVKEVRRRSFMG